MVIFQEVEDFPIFSIQVVTALEGIVIESDDERIPIQLHGSTISFLSFFEKGPLFSVMFG